MLFTLDLWILHYLLLTSELSCITYSSLQCLHYTWRPETMLGMWSIIRSKPQVHHKRCFCCRRKLPELSLAKHFVFSSLHCVGYLLLTLALCVLLTPDLCTVCITYYWLLNSVLYIVLAPMHTRPLHLMQIKFSYWLTYPYLLLLQFGPVKFSHCIISVHMVPKAFCFYNLNACVLLQKSVTN